MPDPSRLTINPRYCDCDPDGRLHTAHYLRYALQAALEAGAPAELHTPGLEAAGWLEHVGDMGLQISTPVAYGDMVEVQTRLARVGPPVWRWEMSFVRDGATIAKAFVDAFDGAENESEADEEEAAPVLEAGAVWDGPVPDAPELPKRAFRAVWRVAWQHLDISGKLDPAWLTQMAGDIDSRAAAARGWSIARHDEQGIAWQAIEHRLELFEPIMAGDELNVISYIGDVGDDQLVRHALIERQDDGVRVEVARARTRWACISLETAERCPIPADWIYDLTDQMAE